MIVKCSHCKGIFNESVFDEHKCDVPLSGVKKIEVVYFHDASYGNKKLMTAFGVDGVIYSFETVPRKAIPYLIRLSDKVSDVGYHDPRNRRRPNRTEKSYCLNMKTLQE